MRLVSILVNVSFEQFQLSNYVELKQQDPNRMQMSRIIHKQFSLFRDAVRGMALADMEVGEKWGLLRKGSANGLAFKNEVIEIPCDVY